MSKMTQLIQSPGFYNFRSYHLEQRQGHGFRVASGRGFRSSKRVASGARQVGLVVRLAGR